MKRSGAQSGRLTCGRWLTRAIALAGPVALALPTSMAQAAGCTLNVIGVSFGNYDVFNTANTDISGSIIVSCDSSTSYSVSLSSGAGNYLSRTMVAGPHALLYNLYVDQTRITIWGDGTSSTGIVSATGMGASYAVFGRIPARQNVPVGSYSDNITVTLTF